MVFIGSPLQPMQLQVIGVHGFSIARICAIAAKPCPQYLFEIFLISRPF